MFQFTPLLGAHSSSRASSSLLILDTNLKILIDCGWSEPFNPTDLIEIEKHASTINLILLTHPTLPHLGSYAHLCAHCPSFSRIPVYCTHPISSLGRSLLQDAYLSTPLITSTYPLQSESSPLVLLTPPSSDEIDQYFDNFNLLKYSQPFTFPSPPLAGLTITAYRAGHTLGGTVWRVQYAPSSENILYAVSWNHLRDAHLSSASFLPGPMGVSEEFLNPTALICSPHNSLNTLSTPRKRRDELLLSAVRKAAFSGGTVLIPTDSSARILELAYLLEHDFRSKLSQYTSSSVSICLAVRTAGRTFRYVRSLLEWMDDSIIKEFESVGHSSRQKKSKSANTEGEDKLYGPFDFKHLKLLEHKRHLTRFLQTNKRGGKIVITSDKSLEWGFSTEVIKDIAGDDRNLIVLTEKGSPGTAGGYLYNQWHSLSSSSNEDIMGKVVKLDNILLDMNTGLKLPLSQPELVAHNEYLAMHHPPPQEPELPSPEVLDDDVSSSSDEEEDEDSTLQGKALTSTIASGRKITAVEEGVNILLKGKGVHDWDVRTAKGRNRMFPFVDRRRKYDEYGEVVRPEDFLKAEDADTTSNIKPGGEKIELFGGRTGGLVLGSTEESDVGKKRKWDKIDSLPSSGIKKARHVPTARFEDESGESDYEPEEDSAGVCKLVINTTTVMMNCKVGFVDYEAVCDGRSLRMLLPQLKPKKIVLIGGDEEETAGFGKEVARMIGKGEDEEEGVFMPHVGEIVRVGVRQDVWRVKLSDALTKMLRWQSVGGLGVVHVVGRVIEVEEDNIKEEDVKMEEEEKVEEKKELVLDVLPANIVANRAAKPIHVGDVRLAELRKVLLEKGHTAELTGEGRLLCDGVVSVVKEGVGRVTIEDVGGSGGLLGGPGRKGRGRFWEVRKWVYEGLASIKYT